MYLYMAITKDKYELPLQVETSRKKLAKNYNITENTLKNIIWRNEHGWNMGKTKGYTFIRVEV